MNRQIEYSPTLNDKCFPLIEVDENVVTVKLFMDVFDGDAVEHKAGGLPPLGYNYANNVSGHTVMTRHNLHINEGQTYEIFNGDIWADDTEKQGRWFKFVGGAQIKRSEDKKYVQFRTTVFDRNMEDPSEGYEVGKPDTPEWVDCSFWSFDYSFSGMNFFSPYNLLLETKSSRMSGMRHEARQNFVFKPVQTQHIEGKTYYSTSEFSKRIGGMFLFDKDDDFRNASWFVKTYGTGTKEIDTPYYKPEGDIADSLWRRNDQLLVNYQQLPNPAIHLQMPTEMQRDQLVEAKISLIDVSDQLLMENGDVFITDGIQESNIDINWPTDWIDQNDGSAINSFILNKNVDIYIKTDSGYLSKNKVNLVNGKGNFYFRALDLSIGDIVNLKVGFKTFSNVISHQIKITDGAMGST